MEMDLTGTNVMLTLLHVGVQFDIRPDIGNDLFDSGRERIHWTERHSWYGGQERLSSAEVITRIIKVFSSTMGL